MRASGRALAFLLSRDARTGAARCPAPPRTTPHYTTCGTGPKFLATTPATAIRQPLDSLVGYNVVVVVDSTCDAAADADSNVIANSNGVHLFNITTGRW